MSTDTDNRTDKQRRVFEYLFEQTRLLGYQPTLRDIADHFGLSGVTAVLGYLLALHKKGWVHYAPDGLKGRNVRAIQFLRRPDGSPFEGFR